MKNNVDSLESFSVQRSPEKSAIEQVGKILSEHPSKAVATAAAGIIMFNAGIGEKALAATMVNFDNDSQSVELSVRGKGEPFSVRLVHVSEISRGEGGPKKTSPQFERMKRNEIKIWGAGVKVNDSIENPPQFRSFLMEEALISREKLGLSFSSVQKMTPQDIVLVASDISMRQHSYDMTMIPRDRSYDAAHTVAIDKMAPDRRLMEGKKVVCRNYAVDMVAVGNTLRDMSNISYLDFKPLVSYDQRHAWVLMARDRGNGRSETAAVDVTFADTRNERVTPQTVVEQIFPPSHHERLNRINAADSYHQNLIEMVKTNLAIPFSPAERVDILTALTEFPGQVNNNIYSAILSSAADAVHEANSKSETPRMKKNFARDVIERVRLGKSRSSAYSEEEQGRFDASLARLLRTAESQKGVPSSHVIAMYKSAYPLSRGLASRIGELYDKESHIPQAREWHLASLDQKPEDSEFLKAYNFFSKHKSQFFVHKVLRQFDTYLEKLDVDAKQKKGDANLKIKGVNAHYTRFKIGLKEKEKDFHHIETSLSLLRDLNEREIIANKPGKLSRVYANVALEFVKAATEQGYDFSVGEFADQAYPVFFLLSRDPSYSLPTGVDKSTVGSRQKFTDHIGSLLHAKTSSRRSQKV